MLYYQWVKLFQSRFRDGTFQYFCPFFGTFASYTPRITPKADPEPEPEALRADLGTGDAKRLVEKRRGSGYLSLRYYTGRIMGAPA